MTKYMIRRILSTIPTIWLVGTAVFFIMRLAGGDPAIAILGDSATAESLARLRSQMGLDQPIMQQYWTFLSDALRGNLGNSMVTGRSVMSQIIRVFPYTLELVFWAIGIGIIIGIPAGILSAVKKNSLFDYGSRIFALIGFSMPAFYFGILLLLLFSIQLGLFPVVGSSSGGFINRTYYVFLPALSLGLIQASFITRMSRSALLEVLQEDYIRTARAKGVSELIVQYRHALRNALIPIITVLGLYIGVLLAGTILTETVFNRPGMGKLLVGAIRQRDYTLIQGGLILYAIIVVFINLAVDLIYSIVDPTVKYS